MVLHFPGLLSFPQGLFCQSGQEDASRIPFQSVCFLAHPKFLPSDSEFFPIFPGSLHGSLAHLLGTRPPGVLCSVSREASKEAQGRKWGLKNKTKNPTYLAQKYKGIKSVTR